MKIWPFSRTEKRSLAEPTLEDFAVFGVTPTAAGIAISAESALRVPAVAAAVRTIADAAAALKVGVVSVAADGTEMAAQDHPVNAILRGSANAWTSGFELVRSLVVDALCLDSGGLCWCNRIGGEIRELINPAAGVITVDRDSVTLQPTYRWQGRPLAAEDIAHVQSPFPRAPLSLAREAIAAAAIMERHASKLFANGARPGGVIETTQKIGDEGLKRMLAGWRKAHEGVDQTGRTAVLFDGASFKPMAFTSVDAQFQELRLFQIQEIARAFNIPAPMIGDLTRATWSNTEQLQRQFLMLTLEPWLRSIESAFNRALFTQEERGKFAVRFERDDFSNVDLATRANAVNSLVAAKVINSNEARQWLDLPPRAGGDAFENPNITTTPGAK